MGKFNKTGKREMPALNTSSLPDLIFTLLFFFMIVTTMREVTLKVQFTLPQGTELEKLEKKSLVTFIRPSMAIRKLWLRLSISNVISQSSLMTMSRCFARYTRIANRL